MPFINSLYARFRSLLSLRYPKLYLACDRRKSVVKFFFAGSSAAAVDLIFLYLFYGVFKWGLVFSTSFAFILSFAVSFTLQKFWTFRNSSSKKIPIQFVLYIGNAFIGLNINAGLMHVLVINVGVWYMLAQVIVNLTIGVYNFFIYKFIVFRSTLHETDSQQKTIAGSPGNVA